MKSSLIISFLAFAALVGASSCKSSEQNYRAAYDRTVERQREMEGVDQATYDRIVAERTANTAVIDGDSVRMVTMHAVIYDDNGGDLQPKPYNVVVGEYKQHFNARSFRDRLIKQGHSSYVLKDGKNNYYVVAQGFDTASEAAAYLRQIDTNIKIKIPIPKPWILHQAGN